MQAFHFRGYGVQYKTTPIVIMLSTCYENQVLSTSFREGVFPRELKKARVVPIYKTGDKSLINNYRPISILSFYSKVFEKLMYNKLYNFIETNDILYAHQYGFRR